MNPLKSKPFLVSVLFAVVLVVGCAPNVGEITVTRSPDSQMIPPTIAVYPLLTTHVVDIGAPRPPRSDTHPLEVKGDRGRVFVAPPAESELRVTLQSQLFSDLLAADLTQQGFRLKQLALETSDSDNGGTQFFVSMETLTRLREDFGLQAVVLGNVYFAQDRNDPGFYRVRAAYVKVVDVETLDVICHVSMAQETYGAEFQATASQIAAELASMSTVTPREPAPPTE